jgi:hypothetical protein
MSDLLSELRLVWAFSRQDLQGLEPGGVERPVPRR